MSLLEIPAVIKLKLSTISSCTLIILGVGGLVEVEQVCTSEVHDIVLTSLVPIDVIATRWATTLPTSSVGVVQHWTHART